jgi:DNA-binding CsgD family transcriptional regulator
MQEPSVPERQSLEFSFVRARWVAAAAITLLLPIGGFHAAAIAAGLVAIALGNTAVWRANRGIASLAGQRGLGVAAVALDTAIVLGLVVAAPADAVTGVYGALVIVVAEAAGRFAPVKAFAAAVLLIVGLAAAMGIRDVARDDPFDATEFTVIAVLVLLAGTVVGSAVREVYRQRVGTSAPSGTFEQEIPQEAIDLLTARERQVLALIVQGYSNQRIAEALVVEQKTVKNHINRIYGKLELNSRYEAITTVLGSRREPTD